MDNNNDLSSVVEEILPAIVQIVTSKSQGTGFFLSNSGLIITNKHVVSENTYVKIRTFDENEYDGQVFWGKHSLDYAYIFTNAPVEKTLKFVDSSSVKIAEKVIAIGHPFGYSFTVTDGIVSTIARQSVVPGLNSIGFLQLDLDINPGNSGGPLIRPNGDVIGMITMAVIEAKSIAFAIPSKYLLESYQNVNNLKKKDLLSDIYCFKCGYLNKEEKGYCDKCGTKISKPKRPSGFGDVLKPPVFAEPGKKIEGPTLTCKICSAINSTDKKYCGRCGAILPETKIFGKKSKNTTITAESEGEIKCSTCGQMNIDQKYCIKCGKTLKKNK